jgi:hypothetical protein
LAPYARFAAGFLELPEHITMVPKPCCRPLNVREIRISLGVFLLDQFIDLPSISWRGDIAIRPVKCSTVMSVGQTLPDLEHGAGPPAVAFIAVRCGPLIYQKPDPDTRFEQQLRSPLTQQDPLSGMS